MDIVIATLVYGGMCQELTHLPFMRAMRGQSDCLAAQNLHLTWSVLSAGILPIRRFLPKKVDPGKL